MNAHKPGPWKWREGSPKDLLVDHDVLSSGASAVVYAEYRDSCNNWVAQEMAACVPSVADARLIAAAPDLLAACREVAEHLPDLTADVDPRSWAEVRTLQARLSALLSAAIAKTEGR